MTTAEAGIALIKSFEGLELEAYQDIAGVWTIGYGHTGEAAYVGNVITEAEADELLRKDLVVREDLLFNWSEANSLRLSQNSFDALISFIYNVGYNGFEGSTAAKRIIAGDLEGAAQALQWWNKARVKGKLRPVLGLTRRRAAEAELLLTPDIASDEKKMAGKEWRETNVSPLIEDKPDDQLLALFRKLLLNIFLRRNN